MNSLLQKPPTDKASSSQEAAFLHALPTAADYAEAARHRAFRYLIGGFLLALAVAGTFIGLSKTSLPPVMQDNICVPIVLLIIVALPVLFWRYPAFVLYLVLASACLFELALVADPSNKIYSDALTDRIPIFWNVNTIFQIYMLMDFKAVPLNLLEVLMLVAGVCSVLRATYLRKTRLQAGNLIWPIAIYLIFVVLGWVNGIATGGDFKISLQEVRAQFYFGIAYLLAVNIVQDRRQITGILWTVALCIGLKGILYTFRRYVTLAGQPLPDQGVGSHEEAYLFDCFICLLMSLSVCKTYSKLRWTMVVLLPFVILGSLACNRRAGTAAFVIIVPLLFMAAYQALPSRRRVIALIALVSAVLFSGYYMAFKNSDSAIAQPARAIRSQFNPDARDANSNAYRDAENADLMATIRSAPLGYGYGKRMLHAVPIVDISADYNWWDIMTHNQVLWVWMRVGSFGFLAFWMMVSAIIIFAGRLIQDTRLDTDLKSVAIMALLSVSSLMIFGLLDLQFVNFRDMLFAGLCSGVLVALSRFAPTKAPPKLAPKKEKPNVWGVYRRPESRLDLRTERAVPGNIWGQSTNGTANGAANSHSNGAANSHSNGAANGARRKPTEPRPASEYVAGSEYVANGLPRQTVPLPRPEPVPSSVSVEVPASVEVPVSAPKEGNSRRVVRNVAATLATQLISWALTFVVTLYLPRYVGDTGLGKLAFAASFMTLFGVVVPLGTSTLLVKEIARDRSRTGELLLAALFLRIPLSLVMTGLAVLAATVLGYPSLTRTLVTVSALGMIVGTVNEAFGCALQGRENLTWQSLSTLVNKFLTAALTIFLIMRHAPLWALAAIGIWTGLASLLVSASAFRSLLPTMRWPSQATMRDMAVAGLPFMGYTIFQTLYGAKDPVILSLVTNDQTVGWFAAAFRLTGTTLFLPIALTTALLPTLSRLFHENTAEFRLLSQRMLMLIMLCGVPFAIVLLLLPERLITLMHYPASFQHSIPVLRIGGIGVLLWFAGAALGTIIFASDGQTRMFRTSAIAAVLGIPACFLCSILSRNLMHNGAVGAIASDVLLEVYLIWAYVRLLPPGTLGIQSLSETGRCAVASLPMAILLAFLSAHGWGLWSVLPSILLYLVMCVVLGCLRPQDLTLIRQAFARKAGVPST